MKLEAEVKNLKSILIEGDKFYQVPNYQRPYRWDKDNLSDLLDDLTSAYANDRENDYFCGSLVLVKNSVDGRFDIIDGQQRTTTFTILSCVLRDIYSSKLEEKPKKYVLRAIQDEFDNTKSKLKLRTDEKHQLNFEQTVIKKISFENTKEIEKKHKDNKYLLNAHYLRDLIENKVKEESIDINEFVIWLFERVVLTVINCPSEDTAIQIFNVLNNRGMPLNSIDILKSSLMQRLDDAEDRETFKNSWDRIGNNLEALDFNFEEVLNAFLYFKLAANPESRLDKELIKLFNQENYTALDNLHEISQFAEAYMIALTSKSRHIHCLKYLRHKIYWSSIISAAHFVKYSDIAGLHSLLVAYYYQNWIAGATIARIKQVSFNILKAIKENKPLEFIKKDMLENLKKYSTTKTYQEEIESSYVYGKAWDKPLLLLIEYFSVDEECPDYIALKPSLQIEHVLPQTQNDEWKQLFNKEEIEIWTNALANLTLLSLKKNVQASNSSFDVKKEVYQNKDNVATRFYMTQKVFSKQIWNVDTLNAREEHLLGKVKSILEVF